MKVTVSTENWIKLFVREARTMKNCVERVWLASGMERMNTLSLTSTQCLSHFVLSMENFPVTMLVYISFVH